MSRDMNKNICKDVGCPDNDPLRDAALTRHHHTQFNSFKETHGGPMDGCGVSECKHVSARMIATQNKWFDGQDTDSTRDERITGVQEDLVNQAAEIAEWWLKTAKADAERTVPKAVEYGAVDFDFMGMFMVSLIKDRFVGADDAELMRVGRELAVTFYMIGKMGRAVGAFQQGVLPSNDTVFDMRIYAMMWERIRQTGDWIK